MTGQPVNQSSVILREVAESPRTGALDSATARGMTRENYIEGQSFCTSVAEGSGAI